MSLRSRIRFGRLLGLAFLGIALTVCVAWLGDRSAAQDDKAADTNQTNEVKADDEPASADDPATEPTTAPTQRASQNVQAPDTGLGFMEQIFWLLLLGGSIAALTQAFLFYRQMIESPEGTPKMIEIAGFVREGAKAYLRQQYLVVAAFFVVVFGLLAVASWYLKVQEYYVPFAFLTGGFWSGMAGFIGMRTATQASSRTAAGAEKSLNEGLQVAFRSGAVMGLTVVGLGMFDMTFWYFILRFVLQDLSLTTITVTMLCSCMGASSQALFARVGGGIFTKAADVGADLVGKVEQGIPEDDPRNPATIADNVGDNVGDVAGMGADLYESFCGSILATAALGVAAFAGESEAMQNKALFLPMLIAAFGTFISIGAIYLVRAGEDASQASLLGVLARGINAATAGVVVISLLLTGLMLGWSHWGVWASISIGLGAGWVIGKWTEYSTSDEYKPTKLLAKQAKTGAATVIIGGVADGMKSVWVPVIVICSATLLAFGFANGWKFDDVPTFALGLYGVGIAAVGMLSTLGITLATDAYGPIADNAGGNAEMSHLDPIVRKRTDALDSLGNTTAATGKGFAIGSAALTALALLAAYVQQVQTSFDRWGDQWVVQHTEAPAGHAYRISNGFVVYKYKTIGDDGEEQIRAKSFLVMPEQIRKPSLRDSWSMLGKANADVTAMFIAKAPTGDDLAFGENQVIDKLLFKETGEEALPISHASIPDFARYYNASLLNPMVLVGIFLGCMSTFVFCAMTMQAVGRAAQGMVEEVRRQFKENPGIMDGSVQPDYAKPVAISTVAAQREMILPSLLGLITPLATGLLLGVAGVIGLLVGTLTCGFCLAIYMANAGGAWDNAKKYIEAGGLGEEFGKGSLAHKAAVVGDTVGDPFKDTSGPSLNILIKLMSIVSVVAAGFIVKFSLF
jgi:inorganic pyrophosphatase/K(+)-stimulated pyrophosphate-energized sodium pump